MVRPVHWVPHDEGRSKLVRSEGLTVLQEERKIMKSANCTCRPTFDLYLKNNSKLLHELEDRRGYITRI